MARNKPDDVKQDKFIAVAYADQIMPGPFEYALNEIVKQHLYLTVFERRYRNHRTGPLAHDPKAQV